MVPQADWQSHWITIEAGDRLNRRYGHRRGFTLAELVVAVGVLLLMLALAGQVMSVTVRSTGQAKALSDVNQMLRVFEQTIREDLKAVQPGNSMMFIQCNPINAYWTQTGRDADADTDPLNGYPHAKDIEREVATVSRGANRPLERPRADILMIFTSRKATSFLDSTVTSNMQQVVYSHAVLGRYVPVAGGAFEFRPDRSPDDAFPSDPNQFVTVPAERWHLARRSVLLMPTPAPPPEPGEDPWWANPDFPPDPDYRLDDPKLLLGETDVVANFDYAREVLSSSGIVGYPGGAPWYLPHIFGAAGNRWPKPYARSLLDEAPLAAMANRLGHYFLPNCASFKVEWALDPTSEFVGSRLDGEKELYWFDPGAYVDPVAGSPAADPLASLQKAANEEELATGGSARWERLSTLLNEDLGTSSPNPHTLRQRMADDAEWRHEALGDPRLRRTNGVAFTATRRADSVLGGNPPDREFPEDVFPGALRITIDLFDGARRLEGPVRHVIVVPVGR
jgi:prepilin-type N-terminal cleavage/methylation domain-containing protein